MGVQLRDIVNDLESLDRTVRSNEIWRLLAWPVKAVSSDNQLAERQDVGSVLQHHSVCHMTKLMDLDLSPFTGIELSVGCLQSETRALSDRLCLSNREVATTYDVKS
jgi:hypothetical protein